MFIGQVVYISIIKAEVANKLIPVSMLSPPRLSYRYGWSFLAIVISFVSCEVAGTMAIFLFNYHHQGCQMPVEGKDRQLRQASKLKMSQI